LVTEGASKKLGPGPKLHGLRAAAIGCLQRLAVKLQRIDDASLEAKKEQADKISDCACGLRLDWLCRDANGSMEVGTFRDL
jgi:hypothetical protein